MAIAEMPYAHIVFALCILHAKCAAANSVNFRAFPIELRMKQGDAYPSVVDIKECCLVCSYNDTCTSVNFNKVSKVCEINTLKMKSLKFRVQPYSGWKLYEKLPCGIGYMSGKRCRHIQNLFQPDKIRTRQEAYDFCHSLGENLLALGNSQDRRDLEADAGLAGMNIDARIWLRGSVGSNCNCYRRKFDDLIMIDCNSNAAIVCQRP